MQVYDRPREIFMAACEEIGGRLADMGFRLSKNGTLKMTAPRFVYKIEMSSSHYNWMADDRQTGYVEMDFGCFVDDRKTKETAYVSMQRSSSGMSPYNYDLFAPGGGLDMDEVEVAWAFIEKAFLPVIRRIEADMDGLLEDACLTPAEDFGEWNYIFYPPLFLAAGREEMLPEYERNIAAFNAKAPERHRLHWKDYIAGVMDKDYFLTLDVAELKALLTRVRDRILGDADALAYTEKTFGGWLSEVDMLISRPETDRVDWILEYWWLMNTPGSYGGAYEAVIPEELSAFFAMRKRLLETPTG